MVIGNCFIELLDCGLQAIPGHIGIAYLLSERIEICLQLCDLSLFFLGNFLYLYTGASYAMLVVLYHTPMTILDVRNL
jgi:hypothetical protein